MAIQTSHLPYTLCPEIYHGGYDWNTQSLVVALENLGLKMVRATQRVHTSAAYKENTSVLNITPGEPLLVVERTCFLEKNTPIEYAIIHNRGDRWDFIMELRKE